jgi:hypothetical protein
VVTDLFGCWGSATEVVALAKRIVLSRGRPSCAPAPIAHHLNHASVGV